MLRIAKASMIQAKLTGRLADAGDKIAQARPSMAMLSSSMQESKYYRPCRMGIEEHEMKENEQGEGGGRAEMSSDCWLLSGRQLTVDLRRKANKLQNFSSPSACLHQRILSRAAIVCLCESTG